MGAPALSLPDSLRQIKQRSRSVCHIMPDAAGMVLVVLMGSTLLCEMRCRHLTSAHQQGAPRFILAISVGSQRCHAHPLPAQRISRQRFSALTRNGHKSSALF